MNRRPLEIWAVDVSEWKTISKELVNHLLHHDQKERESVLRFLRPIDQIRGLAGKLLLRLVLTKLFKGQVKWDDIKVEKTKEGRPFVSYPNLSSPFDFNLTHDGDWVAIAFTTASNVRVGIDVMEVILPHYENNVQQFCSTMDMTMTTPESHWVQAIDRLDVLERTRREEQERHQSPSSRPLSLIDLERLYRLYDLWTYKEAYTKALGKGLGFDFKNVEVRFWEDKGDGNDIVYVHGVKEVDYRFIEIGLPCGRAHQEGKETLKGCGTGGGSRLVTAFERSGGRARDEGQIGNVLSMDEASRDGLLQIGTMEDLVKDCKEKAEIGE